MNFRGGLSAPCSVMTLKSSIFIHAGLILQSQHNLFQDSSKITQTAVGARIGLKIKINPYNYFFKLLMDF